MDIFQVTDYKAFFKKWVDERPKKGRGEYRKLALHMGVSTTLISQIFNGDKHLNLEMASEVADYIGLNDRETDYLFLLVQYQRAGSHKLQTKLIKRIRDAQEHAQKLTSRLQKDKELSEADKAAFYSSWMYSGVRNLCAIAEFQNVDAISNRLNLPRLQVQKVVDFLIDVGLLERKNGLLEVRSQSTHIGSGSLLVPRHHQNWRLQGFTKMIQSDENNLFYTGPMSLSRETAQQIRAELPAFIEHISKLVGPSPSQVVRCLNIDWFEF